MPVSWYLTNLKQYNTAKIVNVEFGKIFANGIKHLSFTYQVLGSWWNMLSVNLKVNVNVPLLKTNIYKKKISNKKHILPSLNTGSHLKIRVKCTKKKYPKSQQNQQIIALSNNKHITTPTSWFISGYLGLLELLRYHRWVSWNVLSFLWRSCTWSAAFVSDVTLVSSIWDAASFDEFVCRFKYFL